ncbi:MAG: hypothetical protein Q7S46_00325 [Gallionella sp.]|nr:hypothetical protein [Gallionella sp.]
MQSPWSLPDLTITHQRGLQVLYCFIPYRFLSVPTLFAPVVLVASCVRFAASAVPVDAKLAAMKSVHLVIAALFLPKEFASGVYADLHLPALEKMLAWGASTGALASNPSASSGRTEVSGLSLESHLCELFGVPCRAGAQIAPISAAFDGLCNATGECWLRADPVHLRLQRDQLVLLPEVKIGADEAAQMCVSLNQHFTGQGTEFFAPHPQRWYMRLAKLPDIETVPLSQVVGRNVHGLLPKGVEALHWHQLFNEIQMLLFAHPVNEAREARGELSVNSVWLWGGGATNEPLQKTYESVSSDDVLAGMLAAAADISFAGWSGRWSSKESNGEQLLVWNGLRQALQRGDMTAWRGALQDFETGYAQPLWQALRSGKIERLRIDALGEDGIRRALLTRADAWAFWRRAKPLDKYF